MAHRQSSTVWGAVQEITLSVWSPPLGDLQEYGEEVTPQSTVSECVGTPVTDGLCFLMASCVNMLLALLG